MIRTQLNLQTSLPFQTEIPLRQSDINAFGHIDDVAIACIAAEARQQYLDSPGGDPFKDNNVRMLATEEVMEYHSEPFFGETMLVRMGMTSFDGRQYEISWRMEEANSGRLIALGVTTFKASNSPTVQNF